MSTHTPGPWITTFVYKGEKRIVHCVGADGAIVIECSAPETELITANVNLALSAPDLLEALEDAIERIERCEKWWIDCPDRGGLDADKMRAAIAKARGEA